VFAILECIFNVIKYWFKLVKCKCICLRVLKTIWVYWEYKIHSRSRGPNLSDLKVQRHIRVEGSLNLVYWECKGIFELKRVWFIWFESAKAHLNCRWSDLSHLKVHVHKSWRRFDLRGRKCKGMIGSKMAQEDQTWVDWECQGTVKNERGYMSGLRMQRQIWEQEDLYLF
jgi:hypothetical protein